MEALIPKLFIITAEASLVLFLLLIIMIIFNSKAKRKDINAVNELVSDYTSSKTERITALKNQLNTMGFTGNSDEQAELLYNQEKSLIKEFVTLYLRRDTYRLLDYPENIMDVDNTFLKTSGAVSASEPAPATLTPITEVSSSTEDNANATILAREQAESNEAHLKELSELRLKNTELNEQLFEALETITGLMTEHGRKTGQEVESNAQKIMDAIIYLRDQRLGHDSHHPEPTPPASDDYDQIKDPWSAEQAKNDSTLDDSTAVNLGINDELNTDLDTLDTPNENIPSLNNAINLEETVNESDPWAEALNEQAQAENPTDELEAATEEIDPWADALAEQAQAEEQKQDSNSTADEVDPWADALAEQAAQENAQEEEEDPWAAALAEQEKSDNK